MPLPITIIWIAVEFQNISGGGRILALDLGKKRIGLALSDPLGISAQGLTTLQRTTIREDLATLKSLCEEHDVRLILMGYPLHMSGAESRQSAYTKEFAERLAAYTDIEIRYWDERLTSVEAGRVLKESGVSIQKRAKAVDRLSAVILLNSFLESQRQASMDRPEIEEETEPA
jgi:putative holliday junction resolvase